MFFVTGYWPLVHSYWPAARSKKPAAKDLKPKTNMNKVQITMEFEFTENYSRVPRDLT